MTERPTTTGLVAKMLHDLVGTLETAPMAAAAHITFARGIALTAQQARLAPRMFVCVNGPDALAALAHAVSRDALYSLGANSTYTLQARWAQVLYLISCKLNPRTSDDPAFQLAT
jgi:hypothetical protein